MSNLLNREITQTLVKDKESFGKLKSYWKESIKVNEGSNYVIDMAALGILYAVLRGKDWTEGFTEITNTIKLENGQTPWQARERALNRLRAYIDSYLLHFGDLLTENAKDIILDLLPTRDVGIAYNIKETV